MKTELIYRRLSPALNSAGSSSSLWCESQRREGGGHRKPSVFSAVFPSLPVVWLCQGDLSSFSTALVVSQPLFWEEGDKNVLHSAHTDAGDGRRLAFWRGQCAWEPWGSYRCQATWGRTRVEQFLWPSFFSFPLPLCLPLSPTSTSWLFRIS